MELKQFTEHERIGTDSLDPMLVDVLLAKLKQQPALPLMGGDGGGLQGMDFDWRASKFVLSYYVGVDWIDRRFPPVGGTEGGRGIAMMVRPKITDVDFQAMFMKCFENREVSKDLDRLFFIRTEDDPIEIPADTFQLEPLILVFFMNLVGRIVRKGLKHDYILREERLNAQIKGKLLMSRYIKHGLAQQHPDHTECRYQEYHVDCLENRIIKAALLLCRTMITRHETALGHHLLPLQQMYRNAISAFADVSAEVTLQDLHRVHINPVFKDYKEAMPLAKMIIRHQGHLVAQGQYGKTQKVPPFIIDMPVLFERYVYCLLAERYGTRLIGYQEGCGDSIMDFTKKDEHMVLDTKYITTWGLPPSRGERGGLDHDNARQLSGYARRTALRSKYLEPPTYDFLCPCVVIYPSADGLTTLRDLPDRWLTDDGSPTFPALQQVEDYQKFYKLPIRLPLKQS